MPLLLLEHRASGDLVVRIVLALRVVILPGKTCSLERASADGKQTLGSTILVITLTPKPRVHALHIRLFMQSWGGVDTAESKSL